MNNNTNVRMSHEAVTHAGGNVVSLEKVRESLRYARETTRLQYLSTVLTAIREQPDRTYLTAQEHALVEELIESLKDFRLETLKNGIAANLPYEQLAHNYGRKSTSWISKIKTAFGITNAGQGYDARLGAERTIIRKEDPFIQPKSK